MILKPSPVLENFKVYFLSLLGINVNQNYGPKKIRRINLAVKF